MCSEILNFYNADLFILHNERKREKEGIKWRKKLRKHLIIKWPKYKSFVRVATSSVFFLR